MMKKYNVVYAPLALEDQWLYGGRDIETLVKDL